MTSPARVLLVDDNRDNLELLSVVLAERYTVLSYASGSDALAALELVRPDVVMLDIGMAPVDGIQCLEAIRAIPGYRDIPAAAITAYARDEDRKSFFAAGFDAVVTKPVLDPGELFKVIARLLTGSERNGILTRRGSGRTATPGAA